MVFVFERLLFLRRARVIPRSFVRGVIEQLEQQQLERDEAIALCEENGSPTASCFKQRSQAFGRPAVEVEQAVVDAGERVCNSLRAYLRAVQCHRQHYTAARTAGHGIRNDRSLQLDCPNRLDGQPELLAGGIGQALLTTAAGLFGLSRVHRLRLIRLVARTK